MSIEIPCKERFWHLEYSEKFRKEMPEPSMVRVAYCVDCCPNYPCKVYFGRKSSSLQVKV